MRFMHINATVDFYITVNGGLGEGQISYRVGGGGVGGGSEGHLTRGDAGRKIRI
jgi:hypothetical protein